MPALNFSGANLAVVAYAEVDGATGTSTRLNSGLTTSRVGLGGYVVEFPTNLLQSDPRDFVIVQAKNDVGGGGVVAKDVVVNDGLNDSRGIIFFDGALAGGATPPVESTRIDSSFFILVVRTTIAPPAGAPA